MKKGKKHTILVIEDDETILSMMVKHLKYEGYKVISAGNGLDGLKLLESKKYDLLVTDIVMPYVSGLGVVTVSKEKHPQIPVIAMTGYGVEPMEAASEKKADLVLAKPVQMSVLKDHIVELLSARKGK